MSADRHRDKHESNAAPTIETQDEHSASLEPISADYLAAVESAESLARIMDSQFSVPGTPIKLGVDTLIGLIPGIGDTIGLGVAGYIVMRGAQMGLPKHKLAEMGFNILIDWAIGIIPIIGDIFDMGWKANNRNALIIRQHFEQQRRAPDP